MELSEETGFGVPSALGSRYFLLSRCSPSRAPEDREVREEIPRGERRGSARII
jgi:hypothetical protein